MQGVRAGKEELIERFGVSRLMAVRVGALLSKRVAFTEAVLELAASSPAVEKALRHPKLLEAADRLDTETLRKLCAAAGANDEAALAVVEQGDERIIALEEELLAEEAWGDQAAQTGRALARADAAIAAADPAAAGGELASVFTDQEIAQLKLTALTSADEDTKMEAMRKLMFAPISDQEKGAVMLKILIDPVSKVRTEALKGLRSLGFDSSLAEAAATLLEGDEAAMVFGADRIARLLPDAGEQETYIVVELLTETLREAKTEMLAGAVMTALGAAGAYLCHSDAQLRALVEACMLRLAAGERGLIEPARRALVEIAGYDPNHVADLLWLEAKTTDVPAVRVFLMTTICQIDVREERAAEVADAVVDEMLKPDVSEEDRLRLRYGAVRLGDASVDPLLDRLQRVSPEKKCIVLEVLDAVASERPIPPERKTRVAQSMLDTLKVSGRQVSMRILQSRICADPDVDPEVQAELAREFLANLREFQLPDVRERILDTLTRIGPPAAPAILDFVEDAAPDEETALAYRVLGRVAELHGDACDPDHIARAVEMCLRCWEEEEMEDGAFVYALGQICAAGLGSPELIRRLAAQCQERLWKGKYTFDILEALGVLAGSPACTLEQRVSITRILTDLVRREPPKEVGSEVPTEDGVMYVFGAETDFDTIVLPLVVRGLERICMCPATTRSLREHIIDCLLNAWGEVVNYRIVWGPLAIDALTRTLCRVAAHPDTSLPYRVQIVRVLSRHLERFSVVQSLGQVFHQSGPADELDELAVECAQEMIDVWTAPDVNEDERAAFLLSLARTMSREHLPPDDKQVRALRRRTIELLFDALKDGVFEVREALLIMKQCPSLPDRQKAAIQDRLDKSFGLVLRDRRGPR